MTLKVGITGNIGSGKTTVCRLFQMLRVPVIYADPLARRLMRERVGLRSDLIDILGVDVFEPNGELVRKAVADKIFSDDSKRQAVNRVVHHEVHVYLDLWFARQKAPYAIEEAALIFESGGDKNLDKVIVVDAPKETRFQRVMERDKIDEEAVVLRESVQWPIDKKLGKADFIINNDGSESLIPQVIKIHRTLVQLSKSNPNGD